MTSSPEKDTQLFNETSRVAKTNTSRRIHRNKLINSSTKRTIEQSRIKNGIKSVKMTAGSEVTTCHGAPPICDSNFIYKAEVAGLVVKRGYITMVEMSL